MKILLRGFYPLLYTDFSNYLLNQTEINSCITVVSILHLFGSLITHGGVNIGNIICSAGNAFR